MNSFYLIIGTLFNFVAAIILAIPFMFVYSEGKLRFKTRQRIKDEAGTYFGGNRYLLEDLLFTRHCALLALPFLIVGTTLLIL